MEDRRFHRPRLAQEALSEGAAMRARLIDLSNNNGPQAVAAIADPSVRAVYAKATEGLHFRDGLYPKFRAAAKKNERVFGAYLFLHPDLGGAEQADYFLAYAKPRPGDLQPVVDSETGAPDIRAANCTFEALYELEKRGYQPLLYGSTSYLAALRREAPALGGYRVWQAEYGPILHRIPGLRAVAWQFTDRDTVCKGRLRVDGSELLVRDLAGLVIPKPVRKQPVRRPHFGRI